MAIPDYQSVMLPLLKVAADGRHIQDATNALADQFGLTEEERKELLPSGVDRVFRNRIGWARTYLKKNGANQVPQAGVFQGNGARIEGFFQALIPPGQPSQPVPQ